MGVATWSARNALFGWNLGSDGATLIYITPGGPAARAGLRIGDRIDWRTLPLVGRSNLAIVEAVSPATELPVVAERNGTSRVVRIRPHAWPATFEIASRMVTLAGMLLTAAGIALVRMRPSRMTWGFLCSSLLWAYPNYIAWQWAQEAPLNFAFADGAHSVLRGPTRLPRAQTASASCRCCAHRLRLVEAARPFTNRARAGNHRRARR